MTRALVVVAGLAFWPVVTCLVLLSAGVFAQEAQAPTLTEAQVDKLRVHVLRVEVAQLKIQALVGEFQKAQAEAQSLVKSLQRDGYDLDLDRMVYVPKKAAGSGAGPLRQQGTDP